MRRSSKTVLCVAGRAHAGAMAHAASLTTSTLPVGSKLGNHDVDMYGGRSLCLALTRASNRVTERMVIRIEMSTGCRFQHR